MKLKKLFWAGVAAAAAFAMACGGGDSGGANSRERLGGLYGEVENWTVLVTADTGHASFDPVDDRDQIDSEIERLAVFTDTFVLPAGSERARSEFNAAVVYAHMVLTTPLGGVVVADFNEAYNRLDAARLEVERLAGSTDGRRGGPVDRGRLHASINAAIAQIGVWSLEEVLDNDGDSLNPPEFVLTWDSTARFRGDTVPFDPFTPELADSAGSPVRADDDHDHPGIADPSDNTADGAWRTGSFWAPFSAIEELIVLLAAAEDVRNNVGFDVNQVNSIGEVSGAVNGMAMAIEGMMMRLATLRNPDVPFVAIGYIVEDDETIITNQLILASDDDPTDSIDLQASNTRFILAQHTRPRGVPASAGDVTWQWRVVSSEAGGWGNAIDDEDIEDLTLTPGSDWWTATAVVNDHRSVFHVQLFALYEWTNAAGDELVEIVAQSNVFTIDPRRLPDVED